jgi:hypothetical protein
MAADGGRTMSGMTGREKRGLIVFLLILVVAVIALFGWTLYYAIYVVGF